jgi:hypothetical protein
MATLDIGGRKVTVDDGFLKLPADQQAAAVEEIASSMPGQKGIVEDVAKGLGSGVVRGTAMLAGVGGDLAKTAPALEGLLSRRGIDVGAARQEMQAAMPSFMRREDTKAPQVGSKEIMGAVDSATGLPITSYKPERFLGKAAQTVGEFVPGALMGGGGMLRGAIAPGLASETAGWATEGTKAEKYARVVAALLGGFLPDMGRRAVTPLPATAERTANVNVLRNEGVTDITAGQATGRKGLQYLEAERGAGPAMAENAAEQFTAAALRRVGDNASRRATPEVIDDNFRRIGGQFDGLAARNTANLDQQFGNDVQQALTNYANLVEAPNRVPAIRNYVQEIINSARQHGGVLPGETYQSIRSRMEAAARGTSNPEARHALREIREAVDDSMERSIAASGNQADLGAWREARNQYRNMLVIERAATSAGENAANGLISPQALRQATTNVQGRRNYARGQGDFADLSRAGVGVMSPLPNSGTPGRTAAQNLGMGSSSIAGALLGGTGGAQYDPMAGGAGAVGGMLAGALMPRAAGRLATSRAGRGYLGNQAVLPNPGAPDPRTLALVNALMESSRQRLEGPR